MTELIVQQPIQAFIDARETIKSKVQKIKQLFEEIDVLAKNLLDTTLESEIRQVRYEWKTCQKDVDYYFWRELLQRGMITNVMTDTAKNDYLEKLKKNSPDFNQENILGLVQNVEHLYKDNAQQMVKEVYATLIGCRYGGWNSKKRDNLSGVNKSFRCTGNIKFEVFLNQFRYQDYKWIGINLGDLLRVCYLLDGRNMGTYADRFAVFADESFKQDLDVIETDYFTIKCYLNNCQLVKWKPEKDYIRQRLNQIGGGRSLPDVMKKRYKQEHFEKK